MKNDKCDLCALKVIFDQGSLEKERHIEKYFDTLRQLQKHKIVEKGHNRRIFEGSNNKSEMCAVNSKYFLPDNKEKKCPEFILNMVLSVPDAFSLNLSKKSIALATKMNCLTWVLVFLTVALLFLGVFPFIQNSSSPKQNPVIIEQNINKATERTQQHTKINSVTNLQNERHK